MLKCGDEIVFAADKENGVIRCLGFKVVLDLGESDTVEDRPEKIVRGRRKEQRSRTKTFELSIVQHLRWKLERSWHDEVDWTLHWIWKGERISKARAKSHEQEIGPRSSHLWLLSSATRTIHQSGGTAYHSLTRDRLELGSLWRTRDLGEQGIWGTRGSERTGDLREQEIWGNRGSGRTRDLRE